MVTNIITLTSITTNLYNYEKSFLSRDLLTRREGGV